MSSIQNLKEKFRLAILQFTERWRPMLSNAFLSSTLNLNDWVKDFDSSMKSRDTQNKVLYVKRGVNLLNSFSTQSINELNKLEDQELRCRNQLLRNSGCSQGELERIRGAKIELNRFAYDIIGCNEMGTDLLLQILAKISFLRSDRTYDRILESLKLNCLELRKRTLKY